VRAIDDNNSLAK
jgi:CTD small phosphatase-like protein 2